MVDALPLVWALHSEPRLSLDTTVRSLVVLLAIAAGRICSVAGPPEPPPTLTFVFLLAPTRRAMYVLFAMPGAFALLYVASYCRGVVAGGQQRRHGHGHGPRALPTAPQGHDALRPEARGWLLFLSICYLLAGTSFVVLVRCGVNVDVVLTVQYAALLLYSSLYAPALYNNYLQEAQYWKMAPLQRRLMQQSGRQSPGGGPGGGGGGGGRGGGRQSPPGYARAPQLHAAPGTTAGFNRKLLEAALDGVRMIGEEELALHELVGSGGFAEVYRASWVPADGVFSLSSASNGTGSTGGGGGGGGGNNSAASSPRESRQPSRQPSRGATPRSSETRTTAVDLEDAGVQPLVAAAATAAAAQQPPSSAAPAPPPAHKASAPPPAQPPAAQPAAATSPRNSPRKRQVVAVKQLRELPQELATLRAFCKEIQIMQKMWHPNVLCLLGVCAAGDGSLRIVTDFLPRGSIFHLLHRQSNPGPPAPWLALQLLSGCARGMRYLHARTPPIIHRDLKSQNLLVAADGSVQVADFGLSRECLRTAAMTRVGSVQWAAPEVLLGHGYSQKCDVWSFGVVCWELMTARIPFDGMSQVLVASKVALEGMRLPVPPDAPLQLLRLMARCWADEPGKRPEFGEIVAELDAVQQEVPAGPAPWAWLRDGPPTPRGERPVPTIAEGRPAAAAAAAAAAERPTAASDGSAPTPPRPINA